MCGRFDTSHLAWRDIHDALAKFLPVKTAPLNLEPNSDVRPTTPQLTARIDGDGWVLEKMRWGLVPFWRNGKPLKDTVKGANDGFKLSTFNCRVETCASASTFKGRLREAALHRAGVGLVRIYVAQARPRSLRPCRKGPERPCPASARTQPKRTPAARTLSISASAISSLVL